MENQGLDDILNGAEPDAVPVMGEAPVEATQPRDEHGRFAPKGEPEPEIPASIEAAPPAASDEDSPVVPLKALQDERSKRQVLEQEIQRLQQQFYQQQAQPQQPRPSVFDDEVGWEQDFGNEVITQAVSQATFTARLDMSEMMARQAHPDFEEKKQAFLEEMRWTPGLREQAVQDPHPWDYAYRYIANKQQMAALGAVDVTDLRAKIRAEVEAEYAAKAQNALKTGLPAGVPPSLSAERNVGSRQGPAWAGPATLADLLNR